MEVVCSSECASFPPRYRSRVCRLANRSCRVEQTLDGARTSILPRGQRTTVREYMRQQVHPDHASHSFHIPRVKRLEIVQMRRERLALKMTIRVVPARANHVPLRFPVSWVASVTKDRASLGVRRSQVAQRVERISLDLQCLSEAYVGP